jgi:hypothetical protein
MTEFDLNQVLIDLNIPDYVRRTNEASLARNIALGWDPNINQSNPDLLPQLGIIYESQGLVAYQRFQARRGDEELRAPVREHFGKAFVCWRTLSLLPNHDFFMNANRERGVSRAGVGLIDENLDREPLPTGLVLAFRVGVSGLLSERITEARLELNRFDIGSAPATSSWRDQLVLGVFSAFIRLIRKANGWGDINVALEDIEQLRQLQRTYEDQYLHEQGDTGEQAQAAMELVGLYHLAQIVTTTGEYLRRGQESIVPIHLRLDRHHERALTAFEAARTPLLSHMADLLWAGCKELSYNAIWTHIHTGVGERLRDFVSFLANSSRSHPLLELWPSQQRALQQNLLDPYPLAILVQMPTSAGKTLLAQFAIVQTLALTSTGTVAYIVPTRALVNQVTLDLRNDFSGLYVPIRVEQAVPAFELDPTEDRLLDQPPHVLVTTPEKLDLLVRRDHPATRNLSLIVADEAHNIADINRGARLELLLGMIRRDRPQARFLLLSPFLPENEELVTWLGEGRALPPITVNWKPSRKLIGAVFAEGRGRSRSLIFETLPSSHNMDISPGLRIKIGDRELITSNTIAGLTCSTVGALLKNGSVLVLCYGPADATERAQQISSFLPERGVTPYADAVCRYLEAEFGYESNLIGYIRHGVVYHHAGLSHDTRWLIEGLIRRNEVQVVCGTTTLAQGVNFPISTVVIETLRKGRSGKLTFQEFWNIAGRAGRAMIDTVGTVAFPTRNDNDKQNRIDFLQAEATEIASQLAKLITRADEIVRQFDDPVQLRETLRSSPELSALLQFLAHAVKVSGYKDIADEVEDLLRASLVYHQVQGQGGDAVRRLVNLCRAYLRQIHGQAGLVKLADQTGFATPSVGQLLGTAKQEREFTEPKNWEPDRLFGEDIEPLKRRIELIAELPEIQLGVGIGQPFSAERIARILRDWVQGDALDTLAQRYPVSDHEDQDRRVADFSRYLFGTLLGRASWGIGALEHVSLSGGDEHQIREADLSYVPSLIFFGVRRKEATWLRMVGVPRVAAEGLGRLWMQQRLNEPTSYDEIRSWVTGLSDQSWQSVLKNRSHLTANDMRLIWREFTGS